MRRAEAFRRVLDTDAELDAAEAAAHAAITTGLQQLQTAATQGTGLREHVGLITTGKLLLGRVRRARQRYRSA